MHSKYSSTAVSHAFDDDTLIGFAGLYPVLQLAERAGLSQLCESRLTVPSTTRNNFAGSHTPEKVTTLIAGMAASADSIDDMDLVRHGGMDRLFDGTFAPSTLGTFLRGNNFGGPAQFGALAREFTVALTAQTPVLSSHGGTSSPVFIDVDDKATEVFGYQKHGAAFGYRKFRGLNSLIATASTPGARPLIVNQRLRAGNAGSSKGAAGFIKQALTTVAATGHTGPVIVRLDSGFYSANTVNAIRAAGHCVSVTVRQFAWVRNLISRIDSWTPINYPGATANPDGTWNSDAAVGEIEYTAFTKHRESKRVPGRLIVRRTLERHPDDPQQALFDTYRYHAFFTTQPADTIDAVAADEQHRDHAIIEQVHADLHQGPLKHFPSGDFVANSIWLHLAAMTYNLLRAAASLTGHLAHATGATISTAIIAVPARLARRSRRLTIHMPRNWRHRHSWAAIVEYATAPPPRR